MTQHTAALLGSRLPFQHGYVTSDIDRAVEHFGRELGITRFSVSERTLAPVSARTGPMIIRCRIAFAWLDGLMIEVIEPLSGDVGIYASALPESGFGLVLHHLAYLVDDSVDWAEFRRHVDPASLVFEASGAISYLYVDTRQTLGHYLEYLKFDPDQLAALRAQIPAN